MGPRLKGGTPALPRPFGPWPGSVWPDLLPGPGRSPPGLTLLLPAQGRPVWWAVLTWQHPGRELGCWWLWTHVEPSVLLCLALGALLFLSWGLLSGH